MTGYSKHIKRLIREYAAEAYERELYRELKKLDRSFVEWRDGDINSRELSDRVHRYGVGPLRELSKRYTEGEGDINVAYAIVTGILDREEIPDELAQAIDQKIRGFQALKDTGDLRLPDDD